ncbi:lipocalin family protein [Hymenobacter cheonanensis]|uniref:lipocalin family protein n=1 Tax=Hymenobacter sp. CA2-7 TaxID=3063993 RepID=UPI0027134B60|nr:lipocalin family protein [Hymenobacter sp. CA2-7]MDO7885897.1 hypothetical protein [Hymenobacter sp. CA2-7]
MKKLSLLFLAALALGSCKKNDDNSPSSASKTDLLTAKSWRISAQTYSVAVNSGTPTVSDEYASSPACERDNFLKFNTNKSLTADEGATKCSPSDPQTQSGSWDLTTNDTKLTLADPSQGGIPIPFDIVDLSATTLHLRYAATVSLGGVSTTSVNDITFTAF